MTAQEFDNLGDRLGKMTPKSMAIAREVLVNGIPRVTVAGRHKLTQARVGAIVERALSAARGIPRDWVRVELWLPPELAQQAQALAAQAKAQASRS